jgi:predicted metal-dependent peptidase
MVRKTFTLSNNNDEVKIEKNFRNYLGAIIANNSNASVFALICMALKIEEDPKIKTMCVTVRNGHYLLKYSPQLVEELSIRETSIVLSHEMAHLSLNHIARMLKIADMHDDKKLKAKYIKLSHIAADYAVNSWLIDDLQVFTMDELKKMGGGKYAGIHPSDVGLPSGKSMEFYINEIAAKLNAMDKDKIDELLSRNKGNTDSEQQQGGSDSSSGTQDSQSQPCGNCSEASEGQPGSGGGTSVRNKIQEEMRNLSGTDINVGSVDDELLDAFCGGIESMSETITEDSIPEGKTASEIAQDLTKDAENATKEGLESARGRGFVPAGIISVVSSIFAPAMLSWKDILRKVCSSSRPDTKERSICKPKRALPHLGAGVSTTEFPGKRKQPQYNIVFCIDTSGSVSDSDIEKIFNELHGLSKADGTQITVVEADATVHKVYELEGPSKISRQLSGRGGTDFNDTFKLLKDKKLINNFGEFTISSDVDLLIYATDGECNLPAKQLRFLKESKVLWISTTSTVPAEGKWGRAVSTMSGNTEYGKYLLINK